MNIDTKMPLSYKIGQMLMTGFSGGAYSSELDSYIKDYHIGGVGLFNRCPQPKESNISSPKQLKELCTQIQQNASTPLFIAVDQEGGKVTRLNETNGFKSSLSPKEMRRAGEEYEKTACQLKEHGINVNFAPCVDVDVNPKNPIIGVLGRSFSSNPEAVYAAAKEAVTSQKRWGIVSCLKHFPGHGSSSSDTHLGMADVTSSFIDGEYLPYQKLISEGYDDMILTAHVINKTISPLPASLAPEYASLLRAWGFKGLIITDDLKMKAITSLFSWEIVLIKAVLAGADILANFNNIAPYEPEFLPHAHDILCNAVKKGDIPLSRIDESFLRIMSFKKSKLF